VSQKTGHPTLAHNCQMLTDFQNSFTGGLSSKSVNEVIINDITTPQVYRCTTLRNINVRKLAIMWRKCLV